MAVWETMIDGEECRCRSDHAGAFEFTTDLLGGKRFPTEAALEAAIKAYKLTLRKNFSNPEAFMFERWRNKELMRVTVTSICEGDTEAWIKRADGKREKALLESLFASSDEAKAALDFQAQSEAAVKAKWAAVKRWAPIKSE